MLVADVSAIIPTRDRPAALRRALDTVFQQTCPPREVIVVVDGPDPQTVEMLHELNHPKIQIILNDRSLTAAGARNKGVSIATSEWVAFLDDDDEWLPTKLERQLATAEATGADFVTCLSRVITAQGSFVWPESAYAGGEAFSAYLFDRRTLFAGAAFLQTSSFLIRRATFQMSPFRIGPHDDWEFALRQIDSDRVRFATTPEPLLNHYIDDNRATLSSKPQWAKSLAWADDVRSLMTARAYSGFCLCVIGPRAAGAGAWAAFPILLARAFARGAPRLRHVVAYFVFWLVPASLRRSVRARFRTAPFRAAGRVGTGRVAKS